MHKHGLIYLRSYTLERRHVIILHTVVFCPFIHARTEFSIVRFKGDKERADNVYNGFTPLSADDVAEAVHYVTTLPPHVNINDLVLMPTAQASSMHFHKTS